MLVRGDFLEDSSSVHKRAFGLMDIKLGYNFLII
jgi:hypothetical protein